MTNKFDGIDIGGAGLRVTALFGQGGKIRIEAVDRDGYWRTFDIMRGDVVPFVETIAKVYGLDLKTGEVKT